MADIPISKMVVPGSNNTLLLRDSSAANKVQSAANDNLASLDINGNLKDSGWKSDKNTTAVSGNPISISGLKSNQLAKNPIITFEPIQAGSGDPSPSNVRAISGYDKIEVLSCGKNLFVNDLTVGFSYSENGFTANINSGKSISISGSPISSSVAFILVLGNMNIKSGEYKISGIPDGASTSKYYLQLYGTGVDIKLISDGTQTFNSDIDNVMLRLIIEGSCPAISSPITFYPMLRDAQISDSTYEPFNPITDIQMQIGQTIYGGSLDLRTGVLTVNRGYADFQDLEDLAWYLEDSSTGQVRIDTTATNMKFQGNITCSIFKGINSSFAIGNNEISAVNSQAYLLLRFRSDSYANMELSAIKTALRGQTIAYELYQPYEIQLTPHEISLLKDYAYVSTNGTNIALDYHNGELASLADVSQLGQMVNLIGDGCILGDSKYIGYLTPSSYSQWVEVGIDTDMLKSYKFITFAISPNSGRFIMPTTIPINLLMALNNISFDTAYSSTIEGRIKYTSGKLYMYLTTSGWDMQIALTR